MRCPLDNTCAEGLCAFYGSGGGAGGGSSDAGRDAGKSDAGGADGGSTRFSSSPVSWSVPSSGLPDGFGVPKLTGTMRAWDTFDLDGDGKPDLIHTENPATGQVWVTASTGAAYWKVYKNTGTGFQTLPILWTVPASGLPDGFFSTASAVRFKQWATYDIDGDNKPDLVQTANPLTDGVWAGPLWKVFKNTGSSFSTTALNWSVPAAPVTLPNGYNAKEAATNPKPWSTLDLDGDRLPDLVLTSSAGIVFLQGATAQWHVYKNLGTGFAATFTAWNVPASGLSDGFTMPNSSVSQRQWATFDLDGDGRADLVHTANTVSNAVFVLNGAAFWRFYKNLGTGFAATFTSWPVPPNTLADGFYASEVTVGTRRWTTRDLNGDGLPDLVHTTNPANSQVWGDDGGVYWNVYRNTGTGFSDTPLAWTVPFSGLPEGFFAHASNAAMNRWLSFDLDGDGKLGLVHTTDPVTDTVWNGALQPIWKLYRGEP